MSPFLTTLAITVLAVILLTGFLAWRYTKVKEAGKALVIVGPKNITANLSGAIVWPVLDSATIVDITQKKIVIVRKGVAKDEFHATANTSEYEGIHCRDNIRADLEVAFYLDLDDDVKTIVHAAKKLGAANVGNEGFLKTHFGDKLSEALKTAVKQFDYADLHTSRTEFANAVKAVLTSDNQFDLCGYRLSDVTIDKIDQTSLAAHDPDNVLDSEGIEKITRITADRKINTNKLKQEEETRIKKDTVEAEENRMNLTKQQREAKARTDREAAVIESAEKAATDQEKERHRSQTEQTRIETEQQIAIRDEEKNREVETTRINNDRVVEIEREKVERAKKTEAVETDREVSVRNMQKEGELEDERRGVAEKEAMRVKIERGIATEREETENLIARETANREKLVTVTHAEAQAEAEQVSIIKVAEARKQAATHNAEELEISSTAQRKADEQIAEGKRSLADATKAELAAPGLAEAEVKTKTAEAIRATGKAENEVESERAKVIREQGLAEAEVIREQGIAKAAGEEASYEAMSKIDPETRQHELDRLNIEKDEKVEFARVEADREVGVEGARAMATAMSSADLQIVGDASMLNSITQSMTKGKALDARVANSDVLKSVAGEYLNGERSLPVDLKELLSKTEMSSGDLGTALLAQFLAGNGGDMKKALGELLNK